MRAIGIDAERAVALGQLGAVGAVDQRDMGHLGTSQPQRLVDLRLAGGIGEVVVAADDVGDAHVVVVDHDRQHVGRRAVGAQQDEVVEILVLPDDAALHLVLDDGLALCGAFSRMTGFTPAGASAGSRSRQRPS